MSWITVALTVGASALQYKNQKDVQNKQDANLAGQLRQQAATRQQAAGRTQQLIQQQSQLTDKPQETAAAKSYNDALNANKAASVQPLANVGNVSDAYKKAANDAASGISTYGATRGANVAAMDAPIQQRRDNVRNIDQYGQDLGSLWRNQRGQDFLSNLSLQGIHQNPYMNILASGMKAYAAGGMGGMGGVDTSGGMTGFGDGGYGGSLGTVNNMPLKYNQSPWG